jgi:hypothetical protein
MAVASVEQAKGIEQVRQTVVEIVKVVQENAATAEELAAASRVMNDHAEHMKKKVADMTAMVGGNGGTTTPKNAIQPGDLPKQDDTHRPEIQKVRPKAQLQVAHVPDEDFEDF